ncbi:MAG TPA: glucosidase, partial [Terriglobia bacterium]|nr:glucosidase [Terriglobia bacterium]
MGKTVRTSSRSQISRDAERQRLGEDAIRKQHWKRWGPYLSERAWGTVREDYSPHGTAWEAFSHDHARSRAYRWNEDGLAGISDRHQYICFAVALWNGRDPILKERVFGLTGHEGNHGEDVKEYYFYLDSTPTHSYMKYLYKYPQAEFPYARLVEENRRRGRGELEYELIDTGVFHENRYFDVVVEYAKVTPEELLVRIQVTNRGPDCAELTLLPTLWFRNTWSWGIDARRPRMREGKAVD